MKKRIHLTETGNFHIGETDVDEEKFPHRNDRWGWDRHKTKWPGDNFPQGFSTLNITLIVIGKSKSS